MRKLSLVLVLGLGAAALLGVLSAQDKGGPEWSLNATLIEACSCPQFCQCFFNTKPAGGHGHEGMEHFCRFNIAYQVNSGSFGEVKLDGIRFWVAGDLGSDFSEGKMEWAMLHFDPSVTPQQREGVATILGHVYPVEWASFGVGDDAAMEWKAAGTHAEARLGGGKMGEIVINRAPGMTEGPVVVKNLKYWGVPRNEGFVMMPNEIEAYRAGDKPFEFNGTTGFMITIDINSKDVASKG